MSSLARPFILSAEPALLRALRDSFAAENADAIVSVSGPVDRPHRMVVMLPPDRAEALHAALGDAVLIAPDDALQAEPPTLPVPPIPPTESEGTP